MNPIKVALTKEQVKLARQIENHEATKAVMEVLGESPKELNKLERQRVAMEDTKRNIAKLEAAVKALDKK